MQNIFLILIIAVVAGFFTVFGCVFTFVDKQNNKALTLALGFAAGIMIGVSVFELFGTAETLYCNMIGKIGMPLLLAFIGAGVLFAKLCEYFVQSKIKTSTVSGDKQDLYKTGIVSLTAIMLHKFPEGIALFAAGYSDITLGFNIALAIALHNLPEGAAIAMPIYCSTGSRFKAFKYTLLAAVAEPIGVIIAAFVLRSFLTPFMLGTIFAFVIGIMLCIAFDELIPASREYSYNTLSLIGILTGMSIMPLSKIFL